MMPLFKKQKIPTQFAFFPNLFSNQNLERTIATSRGAKSKVASKDLAGEVYFQEGHDDRIFYPKPK